MALRIIALLDTFLEIPLSGIRTEEYFGKPNSLYKSFKELAAAYSDTESVESLTDKKAIDKYHRYLSSDFGSKATITDIFDTIFYDYPKFCYDLKKLYNDKKKKEIENPQLTKYYRSVFIKGFVPSNIIFREITQIFIDDKLFAIFADFIFAKKQRYKYLIEKQNLNNIFSDDKSYKSGIESEDESYKSDIESEDESYKSDIESDSDSYKSDIESDSDSYTSYAGYGIKWRFCKRRYDKMDKVKLFSEFEFLDIRDLQS